MVLSWGGVIGASMHRKHVCRRALGAGDIFSPVHYYMGHAMIEIKYRIQSLRTTGRVSQRLRLDTAMQVAWEYVQDGYSVEKRDGWLYLQHRDGQAVVELHTDIAGYVERAKQLGVQYAQYDEAWQAAHEYGAKPHIIKKNGRTVLTVAACSTDDAIKIARAMGIGGLLTCSE